MDMGEFCKANNIKVYYMRRLLELYGQKLMPGLLDLANRKVSVQQDSSIEGPLSLLNDCGNFIAIEVSDQEKVKLKSKNRTFTEFERDRFRLLLDIAMMPYTIKGLKAIRLAQEEVNHVRSWYWWIVWGPTLFNILKERVIYHGWNNQWPFWYWYLICLSNDA